ncbi:MAG: hypothetical protein ABIW31_01010 [Novosphingobium sp.]
MRVLGLLPLALLLSSAANAEKLVFDHRLYPALKQVLDDNRGEMVLYDASNPRYVIDRIAVAGKSAKKWSEALEIIARTPTAKVKTAADWMAELRAQADRRCRNEIAVIVQDDASITYERRSQQCPAERAPVAIYRVIAGKRSLFLLAVLSKSELGDAQRRQWLELLASAHLD